MSRHEIWWRIYVFRQGENLALLNRLVHDLHPFAPEILTQHTAALSRRKREVTVPGDDGYELVLTRGQTKTLDGVMHYQVFVDFKPEGSLPGSVDPGDYGLSEFDRISSNLAHSAPVAAAIKAIQREETALANLRRP